MLTIDPKAWIEGVKDAYAAMPMRADVELSRDHSYVSGRIEGEALRLRHRQEYEQLLFRGRQVRPVPLQGPLHD